MIRITDLTFGYNRKNLLFQQFNLSLQPGNIYGLLGLNGSGKSTLLKSIAGLLYPLKGRVEVNGFQSGKREASFLSTVCFIPEEVYVPGITAERYVNLFAPFYPLFNRDQFATYLQIFDIATDKKLDKLSYGQQKKFVIAFGLACNTATLLLDEPTNGLDIPSKKQFRKLIASVMNEDRIMVVSTHQVRDLDSLIDQVIIVNNGVLLLNESLPAVEEKLFFGIVEHTAGRQDILYAESVLKGEAIVATNDARQFSKINLEHLFNATVEHPDEIKKLFNGETHE